MSATVQRSVPRSERRPLFYRDLASPVAHRGNFATSGQAAAVSTLWREKFGGKKPLRRRSSRWTSVLTSLLRPGWGFSFFPGFRSEMRTPSPLAASPFPLTGRSEESTSGVAFTGRSQSIEYQQQQTPGISTWWSPTKSSDDRYYEKGKGSHVDGVVHSGPLITLPTPREAVKPGLQRNVVPIVNISEAWVTVYGFPPCDTNLILREFEKCGAILRHVPGPGMPTGCIFSIRFALFPFNQYDAQKALAKNGLQMNSLLIVGVKHVHPTSCQFLDETISSSDPVGCSEVPSPLQPSLSGRTPSSRPYHLNSNSTAISESGRLAAVVATPTKSIGAKVIDLIFGV
ncbi:unnamed protein product [Spirodela intermedia]|uniref:Nuclear pore complex protein NUP35 n=1 Tax=Spirodela intermedia TaxID=51605 RepID=A0A7I8JTD1_SPIIN|nr:unnamed protein product [Spirodela intermedia]CAA6672873.1 unnamed protein product [Spirodela intermedia]